LDPISDVGAIGLKAQEVHNNAFQLRKLLQTRYGWGENDARLTVFSKLTNVLLTFTLGLVFLDRHLTNRDWWASASNVPFSDEQMSRTCAEFDMFLRIGLMQDGFHAVESSFRIFTHSLDPEACGEATAPFEGVAKFLLSRLQLYDVIPLFDLWRAIRNTMHNNGLYRPPSRTDREVVHKGRSFQFKYGQPVDFVTTDFVVALLADVVVALVSIVEAEELAKIPHCKETS